MNQEIIEAAKAEAQTLARIIPATMERYGCDARTAAKIVATLYLDGIAA